MSRRNLTVTETTCDGCGKKQRFEGAIEEEPYGFYLTACEVSTDGGSAMVNDIFACSDRCIKNAVIKMIAEKGYL